MIKSVRDLYEQALSKTIANAESREVTKVGTLRGGNAGYMLNGKPAREMNHAHLVSSVRDDPPTQ